MVGSGGGCRTLIGGRSRYGWARQHLPHSIAAACRRPQEQTKPSYIYFSFKLCYTCSPKRPFEAARAASDLSLQLINTCRQSCQPGAAMPGQPQHPNPPPKPLCALHSQNAADPETSKHLSVVNPCSRFGFQVGAACPKLVSRNRARGHRLSPGLERFGGLCSELKARHLPEEG